jgi:hypothetical protein
MIQRLVASMFPIRVAAIGRFLACAAIVAIMGYSRPASATVIETDSFQQGTAPFTPTYAAPAADILLRLTPTTILPNAGAFTDEASGGVPILNDGIFGPIGGGVTGAHPSFATAGGGDGESLTYTLAGPVTLTSVVTLGGWNDMGRDVQTYTVSYSTGGSFIPLATVLFDPASQGATGAVPTASQIVLNGFSIPGVTALEFDFGDNAPNGHQGYAELAATAAPVPEPASLILFGFGAIALFFVTRRQGGKSGTGPILAG